MHYTPNGVATTDTTRIGLRFAKEAPEREVKTAGVMAIDLRIPPGEAPTTSVDGALPVPFNARILAFMPHMHVRGTSFRYCDPADGGGQEETTILDVPKYDFNWQTPYRLTTPQTRAAHVDAARATRRTTTRRATRTTPIRRRACTWGDQTWDEMMIGYVDYVIDP